VPAPVVCPRCATPFQCGIDTGGCWCRQVTIDDATRAAFAEFYDGCLCRECLTSMENDRPTPPTVRAFLMAQLKRKPRLSGPRPPVA
jgi:hypothetical protein